MTLVPLRRTSAPASSNAQTRYAYNDFNRIFDNLFNNSISNMAAPSHSVTDMAIRMDIAETDTAYLVTADIPGLEDKDIELTLHDGLLTLNGERQNEVMENDNKTFHRTERSYGQFKRVLQLPGDADEENVSAHMKNGVLNIEIGKIKEAQKVKKRINIKKS